MTHGHFPSHSDLCFFLIFTGVTLLPPEQFKCVSSHLLEVTVTLI